MLTFKPTAEMTAAAKSALERRAALPESRRAMTETGLARARQLAEGRDLSLADVVEMAAWFERHAKTKGEDASDPDSKWRQAWDGWGGDAGAAAVRRWRSEKATEEALAEARRSDSFRLDAPLAPPEETADGAWIFDAVLATAGTRKTYDHGEEEITAEALAHAAPLLAGLPITRPEAHPWGEAGMIRPDNAARYLLSGARVLEGRFDASSGQLRARILLPKREDATRGLSVGWHVLELDRSAKPPRQTRLRPNHLTLTDSPRDPTARPRLDAKNMKKIKVGDMEYEVSEELYNALMVERAVMDKLRADMDALKGEKAKMEGERSAMDAVVKDVQARLKAADEREAAARLDAVRKEIEPHLPAERKAALASVKDEGAALDLLLESRGIRLDAAPLDAKRAALLTLKATGALTSSNANAQKEGLDNPPPLTRQDAKPMPSLAELNNRLNERKPATKGA